MEAILAKASELGQSIRQHSRYEALREAEKKVMADSEATRIQEELEVQLTKIRQLEISNSPIEVEDKHELERLQNQARGNTLLQGLMECQADYFEMMNAVNSAIVAELTAKEKAEETGD